MFLGQKKHLKNYCSTPKNLGEPEQKYWIIKWKRNKKIANLIVSLSFMKMQPWEKKKEKSTCVWKYLGVKNISFSNIINGLCSKGSFMNQLFESRMCYSTKAISSIVDWVLGWPCKAHRPAFRGYLQDLSGKWLIFCWKEEWICSC